MYQRVVWPSGGISGSWLSSNTSAMCMDLVLQQVKINVTYQTGRLRNQKKNTWTVQSCVIFKEDTNQLAGYCIFMRSFHTSSLSLQHPISSLSCLINFLTGPGTYLPCLHPWQPRLDNSDIECWWLWNIACLTASQHPAAAWEPIHYNFPCAARNCELTGQAQLQIANKLLICSSAFKTLCSNSSKPVQHRVGYLYCLGIWRHHSVFNI